MKRLPSSVRLLLTFSALALTLSAALIASDHVQLAKAGSTPARGLVAALRRAVFPAAPTAAVAAAPAVAPTVTTTIVNYDFNSGTSYATLTPALASGVTSAASSTEAFTTFSGTATTGAAFTTNATAGTALAMSNSSGTNTRYFQFALGGTSLPIYSSYKVYVQARRSSTGAQTVTLAYSTDGMTFTNFSTTLSLPTADTFAAEVFDLSAVTALNNKSNVYFRLLASGASGTGTLRIDNFQVQAEGATMPMVMATKSATLSADVNGNGVVNPGDTLTYAVTISNTGTDATGVVFTDTLEGNLTLVPGSVNVSPIAANDGPRFTGEEYGAPPGRIRPITGLAFVKGGGLIKPALSAFAAPVSHLNPLRLFERPAAAAEMPPARLTVGIESSRPAEPSAPPVALAGETVIVNGMGSGFTLPAGKSTTITFQATIASPLPAGTTSVSNQASVSGSNFTTFTTNNLVTTVVVPPTVMKSFAASPIPVGTNTTMSFKLTNPNAATALNGVGFSDTLPAGVTVVSAASPQCGGMVATTSGSVTFSGGTLAGGSMCTVDVTVRGAQVGPWDNKATGVTSTEGGAGVDSNTATLVVLARPTAAKSFSPSTVAPGGTSTVTITLGNTNAVNLTGAAITDMLPAGVTPVAMTAATTCGGTPGQAASTVSLTGGTIPAGGSCTLTVSVTSSTPGTHTNTIAAGDLTTTEGGANTVGASADLTVASPPTLMKDFAETQIPLNSTATLNFTVTNPNASLALSNVSFTDSFPAGLEVDATPMDSNTCGGTFTATPGATSLSLSGVTLAGGASCNLSVKVKGTSAGVKSNTTGKVSATESGDGATASDSITVVGPPTLSKAFTPPSVPVGTSTSLGFTVTNSNQTAALSGISFTDTLPAGVTVATGGPTSVCGGTLTTTAPNQISFSGGTLTTTSPGNTCSFSVTVTGAAAGAYPNETGKVNSTEGGEGGTASATLNVYAPPTVMKSFAPASVQVGGVSTLTLTITNPAANPGALTGLSFTDTFPAGLQVAATPNAMNSCGGTFTPMAGDTGLTFSGGTIAMAGGSCSLSVNVTPTTAGQKMNNVTVNSTEGGMSAQASATLTALSPPEIMKAFAPTAIEKGQPSTLTLTLSNSNATPLTNAAFTDTLTNMSAAGGAVGGTCAGTTPSTLAAGATALSFTGITVPANGSCTVTFAVTSNTPGTHPNTTSGVMTAETPTAGKASNTANLEVLPVSGSIVDPFGCTAAGDLLTVTLQVTNTSGSTQSATASAMLPGQLLAQAGSCSADVGSCMVNSAASVSWSGMLAAGQTATITYQVAVAAGMPVGARLCITSTANIGAAPQVMIDTCATIDCASDSPVNGQKAGSLLVFPYYTSDAGGNFAKSDTLITLTNVSNGAATQASGAPAYQFLHLFFVNASCSPADTFVCLTPGGSLQIRASEYDPLTTGYLIAVAVDEQGRPVQNNSFIGSAFVRDDVNGVIDSYGAGGFWKLAPGAAPVSGGNATVSLDGAMYEAAPRQFSAQVQDPNLSDQTVVLASVSGDLGTGLAATAQAGVGALYRDDEALASFQPSLGGGCLIRRAVNNANFRVVPGPLTSFLKDRHGYLKFNASVPAVGLLLSRQAQPGAAKNRFAGIRPLHATAAAPATLTLPVLPPFC
jgi:uncharacterized repeat protein (TIGR01451 family)